MDDAFERVREFHLAFNHPAPVEPALIPAARVESRAAWLNDEVDEFRRAADLTEQADAMIDIIYFAIGGLVEMGIKPDRLFDIVHQANMSKLWPDGRPKFREDGKVMKPAAWVDPGPQIQDEIRRQVG